MKMDDVAKLAKRLAGDKNLLALAGDKKLLALAGGAVVFSILAIAAFSGSTPSARARAHAYMFVDPDNVSGHVKAMSDKELSAFLKVMCLYADFQGQDLGLAILKGQDVTSQMREMAHFSYTFTGDAAAARAMTQEIPTADELYERKSREGCFNVHKVVDRAFFLRVFEYNEGLTAAQGAQISNAARREISVRGIDFKR